MRVKMSKQPPPAPTASAVGPCSTISQIRRMPRHWKLTQHHRTTQPPHFNIKIGTYSHLNEHMRFVCTQGHYKRFECTLGQYMRFVRTQGLCMRFMFTQGQYMLFVCTQGRYMGFVCTPGQYMRVECTQGQDHSLTVDQHLVFRRYQTSPRKADVHLYPNFIESLQGSEDKNCSNSPDHIYLKRTNLL